MAKETRQREHSAKCYQCGCHPIDCPDCGKPITASTPFSDWLRRVKEPVEVTSACVSVQNLDYVWHNFRENWIATIEEKQNGAMSSFAQRDTHGVVRQMLEIASGREVLTARNRIVKVEYRGHYVLRFSNTTPSDSEWMDVNGVRIDKQDLKALLLNGSLPD